MVAQHLIERGHKVIVITHAYGERCGVRYLPSALKVYYLPYQVIARQDSLPNYFALLPLLRTVFLRERIELVHAHQALSTMGHEAIFHARLLGIKTVFTDHSLFGFADTSSILTNKLLKFALCDVDHVVCVSHTGRENTVLRAALRAEDVSTIPNAVVARQFLPDPEAAPKGHICVVVLSRLMYRKGIDLLIAAIPPLCAKYPTLRFVIGGDGPKYVELEQMRELHMLHERVSLVGAVRQRDVRRHLTQGHIFLNTSLTEAFGTSIIEATCAGLYVVSTRVGGIPEVLPPSMARLAAPNAAAIVAAVEEAIEHIESGRHDPVAQHRAVARMYSWGETARRLEVVYQRVMTMPPRPASERFARYAAGGGPVAGIIVCIIVAVQMVFGMLLDVVIPRESITVAPSLLD
ncbi:phosphatidylinositol N-acetylglucosaminyltransferase [Malassezia cuniculi]|uniref:Phosphatidylinositol N-acetylglucosaminyltransferase n=1 Tax=Malassezia cuniculi TaxID=948313 RepID=A0AAF0ET85_9BASI|nr:phosphatidylinositol N-acetylglucosaminyltransferase [Malassezia cuniculi]